MEAMSWGLSASYRNYDSLRGVSVDSSVARANFLSFWAYSLLARFVHQGLKNRMGRDSKAVLPLGTRKIKTGFPSVRKLTYL
jgi:hypothetical protein